MVGGIIEPGCDEFLASTRISHGYDQSGVSRRGPFVRVQQIDRRKTDLLGAATELRQRHARIGPTAHRLFDSAGFRRGACPDWIGKYAGVRDRPHAAQADEKHSSWQWFREPR